MRNTLESNRAKGPLSHCSTPSGLRPRQNQTASNAVLPSFANFLETTGMAPVPGLMESLTKCIPSASQSHHPSLSPLTPQFDKAIPELTASRLLHNSFAQTPPSDSVHHPWSKKVTSLPLPVYPHLNSKNPVLVGGIVPSRLLQGQSIVNPSHNIVLPSLKPEAHPSPMQAPQTAGDAIKSDQQSICNLPLPASFQASPVAPRAQTPPAATTPVKRKTPLEIEVSELPPKKRPESYWLSREVPKASKAQLRRKAPSDIAMSELPPKKRLESYWISAKVPSASGEPVLKKTPCSISMSEHSLRKRAEEREKELIPDESPLPLKDSPGAQEHSGQTTETDERIESLEQGSTSFRGRRRKSFPCTVQGCRAVLRSSHSRNIHIKTVHEKIKAHACPVNGCEKTFGQAQHRNRHMREVHGVNSNGTIIRKRRRTRFSSKASKWTPEQSDN